MSAQTVSTCVVCGSETETFLCGSERTLAGCLGKLMRKLGDCAALSEELDTTLSRQDKAGGASVGFVSSGGGERPSPINLGASDAGSLLRDRLGSWARDLWETNGIPDEDGQLPPINVANTIVSLSRWLMRHPLWIALHPAADDLYDEVMETIRLTWRSVDTAPGKVYIGRCSRVIDEWWGDDEQPEGPAPMCQEELYAREGDWEKRCPVCCYIHDVGKRKEVLGQAVEKQYVPLKTLVGLVTDRGLHLTTSMIRNLRARKRITAYVNATEGDETDQFGAPIRPRTDEDEDLTSLFLVGQVLDVITNRYKRLNAA